MIFGAFLINFAALIFLGIATRRTGAFPAAWTSLPLAMGVLTFPLIAVVGDDETEILDGWLEARLAGYTESSGWEETESLNSAVNWRWIARAERTGGSVRGMFIETITVPREEWERWRDRVGMLTDPPKALVATIAWNSGSEEITQVNVWDSPAAVADFFMERIRPIVEAEGEPANKPQRHGEPVVVFMRPPS